MFINYHVGKAEKKSAVALSAGNTLRYIAKDKVFQIDIGSAEVPRGWSRPCIGWSDIDAKMFFNLSDNHQCFAQCVARIMALAANLHIEVITSNKEEVLIKFIK